MAAADVEAVAVLHLRSWRSAYRGMVPQAFLDGLTLDGRVARWAGALSEQETGEVHTIVAEDGALIVGVSSFGSRREGPASDGEIIALHVLPERRRQRIGSLLLDASIDALRARSFIAAELGML